MKKAVLNCLRQRVFFKNLLVERHILPVRGCSPDDTSKLEVQILEVTGRKALVLLPNIMADGENNTAVVDMQYIE